MTPSSCVLEDRTDPALIDSTRFYRANLPGRGGDVDPHILVKWVQQDVPEGSDPIASMIIFEWKDYDLIGIEVHTLQYGDNCCMDAELLRRMNTYVIRIQSKPDFAIRIKRESLSWRQMRQTSQKTSSSLRQYT